VVREIERVVVGPTLEGLRAEGKAVS